MSSSITRLLPLHMAGVVMLKSFSEAFSPENGGGGKPLSSKASLSYLFASSLHVSLLYLLRRYKGLKENFCKQNGKSSAGNHSAWIKYIDPFSGIKRNLAVCFLLNMFSLVCLKFISMRSDLLVKDFLKEEGIPLLLTKLEHGLKILFSSLCFVSIEILMFCLARLANRLPASKDSPSCKKESANFDSLLAMHDHGLSSPEERICRLVIRILDGSFTGGSFSEMSPDVYQNFRTQIYEVVKNNLDSPYSGADKYYSVWETFFRSNTSLREDIRRLGLGWGRIVSALNSAKN